jgi:hypothetical protein
MCLPIRHYFRLEASFLDRKPKRTAANRVLVTEKMSGLPHYGTRIIGAGFAARSGGHAALCPAVSGRLQLAKTGKHS